MTLWITHFLALLLSDGSFPTLAAETKSEKNLLLLCSNCTTEEGKNKGLCCETSNMGKQRKSAPLSHFRFPAMDLLLSGSQFCFASAVAGKQGEGSTASLWVSVAQSNGVVRRQHCDSSTFSALFRTSGKSSQAAPNNKADSHDNGCGVSTSSTSKQGGPQNAHGADTVENSFEPKTSGNWSWESIQCHKPHLLLSKIVLMWGDKGDSGKDQLSNFSVCGERLDKKGTILVSMHSYSIRVYCHDSPSPYVLDCRKFCQIMLPSLLW